MINHGSIEPDGQQTSTDAHGSRLGFNRGAGLSLSRLRKIVAPEVPSTTLQRERLALVLEKALRVPDTTEVASLYHLLLLCAPAGYGKTTLLAATFQRLPLPCCWYFLDPTDAQEEIFLTTLLASIRQRFPGFGPQLDQLLAEPFEQKESFSQRFIDALLMSLESDLPGGCVLILCNYQEVNESPGIHQIIDYLLKHLPPRCVLVIESRALPDLELAPLIMKRKALGLGARDLRFSAQDLSELAQIQNLADFSEREAEQVATAFDGWIAGIMLGSRFGTAQARLFSAGPGEMLPGRQFFAGVIKEMFGNNAVLYTFLKQTSLLEELVPAFCDELLETSNATALLQYAERQGLFLSCVRENAEPVYVFHPVLRAFFAEELRRHEPDLYHRLHHRIAMLFQRIHAYDLALRHAFEAQEYDLLARIVIDATPMLLENGQSERILSALDVLLPHLAQKYPLLSLIRVNTYIRRGDFASARRTLEEAEGWLQEIMVATQDELIESAGREQARLRAEFTLARGCISLHQGDHQLASQYLQQALSGAPPAERFLRIRAHQQLGICLTFSGAPIHEGIAQFQQALRLCQPRTDKRMIAELHHQLANSYEWAGNYTVAEHHRQHLRTFQDDPRQPLQIINNLIGLGLLKMRQGLLKEAEISFRHLLQVTQDAPRFLSSRAYTLLSFGELELNRRAFKQALAYLEEALSLARQLEDRYLLNETLHTLSLVYLRMGDHSTAQCLLEQAVLHANETGSYEGISHALLQATVFLAQQLYEQAREALAEVATRTENNGIKWLHTQAVARLASCHLALEQPDQAKKLLRQIVPLGTESALDYVLQIEVQVYPALQTLLSDLSKREEASTLQAFSRENLRIYALGEPVVSLDGKPVTHWRMARALELYFLLLQSNQPLRKEQILTALWPEMDDPERVSQTLRSTIYYLRHAIGEKSLVKQSGLYWLDLRAVYGDFWYDVTTFEELQQRAHTALDKNDDDAAAQALHNMVDLYRGDYLQAFYSDWCIPRRDTLRQAFMEAHQQLAFIAWRKDAYDESLHHWQYLLTLDSCLEIAHSGMIRCYMRQGKRDLALRQYQYCRQELHDQLQATPGPSLQKLYQRLLNDKGASLLHHRA